jgi:hypothetical protein
MFSEGLKRSSGGQGIRHGSYKSLPSQGLGQSAKLDAIKSVIVCDDSANEQLSNVVSAWSALPPYIRGVILLLVRQHVK